MILQLTLDLPEDHAYLKLTRIFGRTLLEHMKVCEEDVNDLEIVVGELCSNVVRHARSCDKRFRVSLEYFPNHVCLVVEDHGLGFSFKDVDAVGTTRPDFNGGTRVGGFGMQLIRSLADHVEFYHADPTGSVVRAQKNLRYQSVEAAEEANLLDKADGAHAVLTVS